MNPLRTPEDYELFLYTLTEKFPSVRHSTMTFVRRGASLARVTGELLFDLEIRLVVRERILYDRLPCIIDWYGYEVWTGYQTSSYSCAGDEFYPTQSGCPNSGD